MSRTANRRDGNEQEIIDALVDAGATVEQWDKCDLVVGYEGNNFLIEVKMPKRRHALRPIQIKFRDKWQGQWSIATNPTQALIIIGAIN